MAEMQILARQVSDFSTASDARISAARNVADGICGLDSGGKVAVAQLPSAVLGGVQYQGTWNATTNSPALSNGSGSNGYYYRVATAGTTSLDGIAEWAIGDWVVSNGTVWQKIDNTDAVTSVNGYTGAVSLVKNDVGLGSVENTALSTWAGTTNITTLGTIATGVWSGTAVAVASGGTGATTAADARTNLGLGTMATAEAADYLPLAGGTMTGPITGTSETVQFRNGTSAQIFEHFYSYTDGSNYQGVRLSHTSTTVVLAVLTAGTGGDNINVVVQPAGTGYFSLQLPDSTAAGGNARGAQSVDLQVIRDVASHVASGQTSFCAGYDNTASGSISVALGWGNVASGSYDFSCGRQNTSSGGHCFTAQYGNTASANFAGAMGRQSTASAEYAFAHGYAASATHTGAFCFADGSSTGVSSTTTNQLSAFFTNGYALMGGAVGIGTATPTNLLSLGGNSARTFWMERHTTANTAGNALTIQAGGATSGATDKNGGYLNLYGGLPTGTGESGVRIYGTPAGASGTTDGTPAVMFEVLGNKVGLFGVTPVVRPTALTAALTTVTCSAPGTPDYAIQDPVAATGYGFVTLDEALSLIKAVANAQVRIGELETKLQALGALT